jgi:hypothetical protein
MFQVLAAIHCQNVRGLLHVLSSLAVISPIFSWNLALYSKALRSHASSRPAVLYFILCCSSPVLRSFSLSISISSWLGVLCPALLCPGLLCPALLHPALHFLGMLWLTLVFMTTLRKLWITEPF